MMDDFKTMSLAAEPNTIAPDGSEVRILLGLSRGGMAHFSLRPGQVSKAVAHKTIEEIWYFVSGSGRMWRRQGDHETVVSVDPGVTITIPTGTHFQFRNDSNEPLAAVGVTMPPWPGDQEAYFVEGKWPPKA